jgi:hypothetical protein
MSLTLLGNDTALITTTYGELGLDTRDNHQLTVNSPNIDIISKQKFDNYLTQAIDEVITSLGPAVSHALFDKLNQNFNINTTNIADRIDDLVKILHRIFGLGATRLELRILQVLNNRIQAKKSLPECEYTVSKWIEMEVSFIDTLYALKTQYLTSHF